MADEIRSNQYLIRARRGRRAAVAKDYVMTRTSPLPVSLNGSRGPHRSRCIVLDELRRVFELHGFAGIETRAVETGPA